MLTEQGRAVSDKPTADLKKLVNQASRAQANARKAATETGEEAIGDQTPENIVA